MKDVFVVNPVVYNPWFSKSLVDILSTYKGSSKNFPSVVRKLGKDHTICFAVFPFESRNVLNLTPSCRAQELSCGRQCEGFAGEADPKRFRYPHHGGAKAGILFCRSLMF